MPSLSRQLIIEGGDSAASGGDWLTVAVAAAALGLSVRHIRRMAATGELTARQVDGDWLIDPLCRPALAIAAGVPAPAAIAGDSLAGLSAAKRAAIHYRLSAVRAYLAAVGHRPPGMMLAELCHHFIAGWNARHVDNLAAGAPRISVRTLCRWVQCYRDCGVAGLLDARRYAGRLTWTAEAREFFEGLYLDEARPAIPRLYERMAAIAADEGWQIPTLRTVTRHARERLDPKLAALGRDPKRFRDRMLPHVVRDWSKVPAMGLWVADHRQVDVFIPHLVYDKARRREVYRFNRPWLTLFLDARSWMPVAWRLAFDSPTGNRVMETFISGVESCGTPEAVYLDNGKDFRMYRFAGGRRRPPGKGEAIVAEKHVKPLLELLGVKAHFSIPYNAKAKIVEPWFKLMAERFDKTWATYTGPRADRRPERLKALHGRAAELYAGGLTLEAFQRAFDAWVMDDYALRESPSNAAVGPGGEVLSAIRAFHVLRRPGFQAVRPSADALAILLMPSLPVRVEANGVYVRPHGQYYWADELEDRRGASGRDVRRKITYRYREGDASAVYIFDAASDKFLAVATPYAGMNIDPLAECGSQDEDRLSAAMALQRSLARRTAAELAGKRRAAGNRLLAASRRAGEVLGLHDDLSNLPPAPPLRVRLHPELDRAGVAAARHDATAGPKSGRKTAAQWLSAAATGTDDRTPASALVDSPSPTALDILAAKEPPDAQRSAGHHQPPLPA